MKKKKNLTDIHKSIENNKNQEIIMEEENEYNFDYDDDSDDIFDIDISNEQEDTFVFEPYKILNNENTEYIVKNKIESIRSQFAAQDCGVFLEKMDFNYKSPIRRFDDLCYFYDINELKFLRYFINKI